MFAIILPLIFSFCALAFDGSRLLSKKARLADALNEAALAIATAATSDPDAEEKIKLNKMLNDYLNAYLPSDTVTQSDVIVSSIIDPVTNASFPVFDIRAKMKIHTMLPFDMVPAFATSLDLNNRGKVRKGGIDGGSPVDYVFLLDFSNSMNDPSAESGKTRIQLLKQVVNDITAQALDAAPETTFALVPFDNGVLTRYPNSKTPKLNELGGAVNGCSILMVPKKIGHPHLKDLVDPTQPMQIGHDLDFDFWADKYRALESLPAVTDATTKLPYTLDQVNLLIDKRRLSYYENSVLTSLKKVNPAATMDTLVDMGWCEKSGLPNRAKYSCDKHSERYIFTDANQKKIMRQMEQARRYSTNMIPYYHGHNPLNLDAIDIEATLNGMFDKENIITFPLAHWRDTPFGQWGMMCYSAALSDGFYNQLAEVVPNAYMIESTSDLNELKQFQDMEPLGNTFSSSGLLRAVPEMMKGTNPRTVMIIISDGADNDEAQDLLNALHKDRNEGDRICDRIRKGIKERKSGTEDVQIYFISVVDGEEDRKRTKYWADYCTGAENAIIATDYSSIMDKLVQIMSQSEETGYFYN